MEEGWGGKSSLAHFCRMNFADKTRQVSRGGGSLSRGIRRGALSRKTNAPVKMNARPCLPLPALPNDLTSSIHLQFFDGNPFPMKGRCFETGGKDRNNRLLARIIVLLFLLFFLSSFFFFFCFVSIEIYKSKIEKLVAFSNRENDFAKYFSFFFLIFRKFKNKYYHVLNKKLFVNNIFERERFKLFEFTKQVIEE